MTSDPVLTYEPTRQAADLINDFVFVR